jgi:hypothetical protein
MRVSEWQVDGKTVRPIAHRRSHIVEEGLIK